MKDRGRKRERKRRAQERNKRRVKIRNENRLFRKNGISVLLERFLIVYIVSRKDWPHRQNKMEQKLFVLLYNLNKRYKEILQHGVACK
jgi:hypothetical protein